MKRLATIENIETDLRARVEKLRLIKNQYDADLCEELAFYNLYLRRHYNEGRLNMKKYLEVMKSYYENGVLPEKASKLKGQLGFLVKVYTGQNLSPKTCEEGSSLHKSIASKMYNIPRGLNDEIKGWKSLQKRLQKELGDINPKVITNMMIDESLELLGRDYQESNKSQ